MLDLYPDVQTLAVVDTLVSNKKPRTPSVDGSVLDRNEGADAAKNTTSWEKSPAAGQRGKHKYRNRDIANEDLGRAVLDESGQTKGRMTRHNETCARSGFYSVGQKSEFLVHKARRGSVEIVLEALPGAMCTMPVSLESRFDTFTRHTLWPAFCSQALHTSFLPHNRGAEVADRFELYSPIVKLSNRSESVAGVIRSGITPRCAHTSSTQR
ncbi:hypothetical protein EDB87DRAFT_1824487 [Lactarius vividus]|nr:hypothetical protein EDB87DRAFT_1824487 [Lactarius vividus]